MSEDVVEYRASRYDVIRDIIWREVSAAEIALLNEARQAKGLPALVFQDVDAPGPASEQMTGHVGVSDCPTCAEQGGHLVAGQADTGQEGSETKEATFS